MPRTPSILARRTKRPFSGAETESRDVRRAFRLVRNIDRIRCKIARLKNKLRQTREEERTETARRDELPTERRGTVRVILQDRENIESFFRVRNRLEGEFKKLEVDLLDKPGDIVEITAKMRAVEENRQETTRFFFDMSASLTEKHAKLAQIDTDSVTQDAVISQLTKKGDVVEEEVKALQRRLTAIRSQFSAGMAAALQAVTAMVQEVGEAVTDIDTDGDESDEDFAA